MKKKLTIHISSLALVLVLVQSLIPRDAGARGNPTTLGSQQDASAQLAPAAEIAVTTPLDDGPGSLRDAINRANENPDKDNIVFRIPSSGQPIIISLKTPLRFIGFPICIDGTTQPGFKDKPIVILDGSQIAPSDADPNGLVNGLELGGGDSVVRGLIITGFFSFGIRLEVKGNNLIENNIIGTDAAGAPDLSNGTGIGANTSFNRILNNVISGNQGGLHISGSGNRVEGNKIGVDCAGTKKVGNVLSGVAIFGFSDRETSGNVIRNNVISGNTRDGVSIFTGTFGNEVTGNNIGTDITGTITDPDGIPGSGDELGNGTGVLITQRSRNNTIGGTAPDAGNVISGNRISGVSITNGANNNKVQGNKIGTDTTGTKPLPNRGDGVRVDDSSNDNIIGGAEKGAGNVISGNKDNGIYIGPASTGNQVQGNKIGVDSSGIEKLGNTEEGVRIEGADNNTIGGMTPGAGNIIGGNGDGMSIINASNTTVQGNFFGTNPIGDNLGNEGAAIGLAGNSSNNKIGGQTLTAGNWIANNRFGILGFPGTSGNLFLFNSIFDNTEQSILLASNANRGIRPPQLTSTTASNNETIIRGSFSGRPNSQIGVQYSLSSKFNPLEGKIPFGSITITTNSAGLASADARVPLHVPSGLFLQAIATDLATNDSSAFSNGVAVTGTAQPDLKVEKSGPQTAGCRENIIYTITVTNVGTAAAFGASVIDTLPECVGDEVEVTTSQSDGFTFPQVDRKAVTSVPRLAPSDSVTITIKATLTEKCADTIVNRAKCITLGDLNSFNDSDDASTKVEKCPKITGITTSGKNVVVSGTGFERGDKIEINGRLFNTKFTDSDTLLAKKGKKSLLGCDQANPGRTNVIRLFRERAFQPIQDTSAFATCP